VKQGREIIPALFVLHSLFMRSLAFLFLTITAASGQVPETPGLYATLDSSMGAITVKLLESQAPNTVKNFVALANGTKATLDKSGAMTKRRYYDGLTFHRVVKGFMIQAGDLKGTGDTPCGVPHLKDEIDPSLNFKEPGMLAMANTGKPNTASCQFFITVGNADYLTGMFTIFGQVVAGQDVADRISRVPTVSKDKPLVPVKITSVTIERKQ
jgi:peptidyl-prolyl cis-trans isomerase A (cyclophilin A)